MSRSASLLYAPPSGSYPYERLGAVASATDVAARSTWMTPAPARRGLAFVRTDAAPLAVFIRAVRTWARRPRRVGLAHKGGGAGGVRGGHGRTRDAHATGAEAGTRGLDADARCSHVRLEPVVTAAGPAGREGGKASVAGVRGDAGIGHRDCRAVRREQAGARGQGHAQERDLDDPAVPRDRALEGRQRVGVVDHDHGGRAGRFTEDGAVDAGAHAPKSRRRCHLPGRRRSRRRRNRARCRRRRR